MIKATVYSLLVLSLACCRAPEKTNDEENTAVHISKSHQTGKVAESPHWTNWVLKGQIDGKYEVMVWLQNKQGIITGKYFYTQHKRLIDLKGEISDGRLTLQEYFKNEETGLWVGTLEDDARWVGTWQGNGNTFSFQLETTLDANYKEALKQNPIPTKQNSFQNFLALFEPAKLPLTITTSFDDEENALDTLLVQKYLDSEFLFGNGWGYNHFVADSRIKTPFGHLLTIFHHFTPGAFGIYNTYVKIFTFNNLGEPIDSHEVGCYCYDSNLGSNDYFESAEHIVINAQEIVVRSTSIHATLFEENMAEGEELIHEESEESHVFAITPEGLIEQR